MKLFLFAVVCSLFCAGADALSPGMEVFQTEFFSAEEFRINAASNCSVRFGAHASRGLPVSYELADGGNILLSRKLELDSLPDRIVLKLTGDESSNQIALRLIDAEGETFRFPLKNPGGKEAVLICSPAADPCESWGKKTNRKIDLPIREIALEIRSMSRFWKCLPKGTLFLKELTVHSRSAARKRVMTADRNPFPVIYAVPRGEKLRFADVRDASGKISGRFAASFDDQFLFLTFQFRDSTPKYPHSGIMIYENDCVELWFDARRDSLFGLTQEDDVQIVATPKNSKGKPEFRTYRNSRDAYLIAASSLSAETDASGWKAELRIPLDGLPGLRNDKRAVAFALNQVDNQGKTLAKAFWGGREPLSYGFLVFGNPDQEELASLFAERRRLIASLKASERDPMKNTYRGEPRIYEVKSLTGHPRRFERLELAVRLDAEYRNPFNFEEMNLFAEFVAPSGKKVRIDGFLYRKYELILFGRDAETIGSPGNPEWRLRFAPTETGTWRWRVQLKDRNGRSTETAWKRLTVESSKNPGFLRVSRRDPRYLAFDSGRSFYGLGFASHFWNTRNVVLYTKHYLNQLAAFGGNYTSINLEVVGNGGFGLQVGKPLGVYSLENAFRLDYILECAERRGIYLIACLHQTKIAMLSHWKNSIYSTENGGPCAAPEEFFSSQEMRRIVKNRLRYLIARWGYSTNLLGFEIFNEVNYTDGFRKNPTSVVDFHREIGSYLRTIDPNRHLISTCFGSSEACELPEIWHLPEIDFTITHSYANDIAGELFNRQRNKARYGKPVIGGENGMPANFCGQAQRVDPSGISFHNNLWASLVTKSAGNVLQWWYSHFHDPLDLYGAHYPQFRRFIEGIAFDREEFRAEEPVLSRSGVSESGAKEFPCVIRWPNEPLPEYTLAADGIWWNDSAAGKALFAADLDCRQRAPQLPGLLREKGSPGSSLKLRCTLPRETVMRIFPAATGTKGSVLIVSVNGRTLPPFSLADRDGKNNPFAKEFSHGLEVPLHIGVNALEVKNLGDAFVSFSSFRIDRFGGGDQAENVRAGALSGPRIKLVWIQNKQNTWYKVYCGEKVETVRGIRLHFEHLDGLWELNWYDPYEGRFWKTERIDASSGRAIPVPEFQRDIALKMKKISSP